MSKTKKLLLACALVLAGCTRAPATGAPTALPRATVTAEPAASPTSVVAPTQPAPTATATASPAPPPQPIEIESHIPGTWRSDIFIIELKANHSASFRTAYDKDADANGHWTVLHGSTLSVIQTKPNPMTLTVILRGNILVSGQEEHGTLQVWRKQSAAGEPLPANVTDTVVPAPLFDVAQAQSVLVSEAWSGLSPVAPGAIFTLTVKNGLRGTVHYWADWDKVKTADAAVSIGAAEASAFLQALAAMPVDKGPYQPSITHTDDYPHIKITVKTAQGDVEFFSDSQGADRLPWGVNQAGVEYASVSDLAAMAWSKLDPFLHRDVHKALVETASRG